MATCLRSLETAECYQSATDQGLQHGVDDSVSFEFSVNYVQGVCGHGRAYARMWESKHRSTDGCPSTVVHEHHILTL